MPVYIDNAYLPFRRMVMCHMIADTTEELLEMADKIGVARKWIQDAGGHQEHFDICKEKRLLAVQEGAIEVDKYDLGRMTINRAKTGILERIKKN